MTRTLNPATKSFLGDPEERIWTAEDDALSKGRPILRRPGPPGYACRGYALVEGHEGGREEVLTGRD
jgi:hypothetical protein